MPILKSIGRLGVLTSLIAGMSAFAEEGVIEEVVVTGSYIRGTPEDAELPVDVISRQELEDRGNPNMLDIIRAMPYVSGVMGETNQFGANQGTIGTGNVNLRGLGGMRTLVLMNGRRTTYTPAEGPAGVDTNLLPIAAMGRVEVLKDGAAATYGSDAIAGVVNFITRKDLDGLELNLEHRNIQSASGDWTASANWGWVGDNANALLSFGLQRRAELKSTERDWAFPDYLKNPTGWSAAGMPGTYVPRLAPAAGAAPGTLGTALAGVTVDSNCTDLGGFRDPGACRFSFIPFDNLVEKTEQHQLYGEINVDLTDTTELHIEGLWAKTVLPEYRTSPGYPPTSGPFGPGGGQFTVNSSAGCATAFCNNPGAALALAQSALSAGVRGATRSIQLAGWRPQGWGGVPELTGGNGGQLNRNFFDMNRVSASLKGTFEDGWVEGIGWDLAVTYSDSKHKRSGVDTMITRLQSALNGLGGPNCNGIAFGLPGSTCGFYNPFANAISHNPALGLTNPGHNPAFANTAEIKDWMIERWDVVQDQSLLVVDGVVNGELPFLELPGGNIGWAAGGQFRKIDYQTRVDNPLTNSEITPCPIPGDNSCAQKTGPFIFLGQFINQNLKDDVYAGFIELAVPVLESLNFQIALRYEDYGGLTGDTLDPKISGRWQATDWLAFRGSWGTTFRGPTPVNLSIRATGLQPLAATGGQYRSIDNFGNPDLKPETADTMSFGAIFQWEALEVIVDYWSYEFKEQITSVPFQAVSNAVGGTGNGTQLANCNHALRYLVTFDNGNTCTQGVTQSIQMQRILANVVNGSPVDITGFDVSTKYTFDDLWGGELMIGVDATILNKYDVTGFSFGGVPIFADYSAKGFANQDRFPGLVSEMRAIAHVNYSREPFNLRYEMRFVKGVEDERPTPRVQTATPGLTIPVLFGKNVDDLYTHNLYANWDTPWNVQVSFSVVNILDEDPPQVRHQLSYDPYIGDPLGRTFELGVKYTFGQD